MWVPKKLQITNFISHKDTTFEFLNGKVLLIQGENLDDDFQDSNGSGKSAIIEAVAFNFTGDLIRKDVRVPEMILEGENELSTEFYLENKSTNQTLLIKRSYKLKKSQQVELFVNDEQIKKSGVNEYNKEILNILGISRDDLINYFIISKEKYQSFLLSTDSKKKETISRFSNSNLIEGVDILVNTDIEIIDAKIQTVNNEKQLLQGSLIAYEEQLDSVMTKAEFIENQARRIKTIEAQIKSHTERLEILEQDYQKALDLRTETQKKIQQIDDISEYKQLLQETDLTLEQIQNVGKELRDISNEYELLIQGIKKNLAGKVQCPKCKHEFIVSDPSFDVKQAQIQIKELQAEKLEADKEIKEKLELYNTVKKDREIVEQQIKAIEKQKNTLEQELTNLNYKIKRIKFDFDQTDANIIQLKKQIEIIENEEFVDKTVKIRKSISKINADLKKLDKELDKYEQQKADLIGINVKFKKFKTYLSNKSIKAIESYTNLYLSRIRTNLAIKLDGHKLLADNKTIRDKITVNVLRNGMIKGAIGKFSSGEKVRIDICNILALQNLININAKSGGLDLLILDEIIESVDPVGVQEILTKLDALDKTICVITHANNFSNFENVITVRKENGISKLLQ